MQKIAVIGNAGSGKSTFARDLGQILGIEVIHLDALFWNAGWIETPKDIFRSRVEQAVRGDAWVSDGNYTSTFDIRLLAADTIVFLDLPLQISLWRVVNRWICYSGRTRADMAPGCPERFALAFLRWIWDYPKRTRPTVLRLLEEQAALGKQVFVLRKPAEIEGLLINLRSSLVMTAKREVPG